MPRISYGVYIFVLRSANLKSLKAIIRCAVGNNKVCISAVYNEMKAMAVEAFSKYMQLKNIVADSTNTRPIYDSGQYYNDQDNKERIYRTRIGESRKFIKKNNITLGIRKFSFSLGKK